LFHFTGKAYGPVVVKEKEERGVLIRQKGEAASSIMHLMLSTLFRK
jgi:hypothetical protein